MWKKILEYNPNLRMWNKRDFLIFYILIPSFLVVIHLLPQNIKDTYFILKISEPTYVSMFFSKYTHFNLQHLRDNLLYYFIYITFIFNFDTNKKLLYHVSASLLFIFPFVASWLSINNLSGSGTVQGFSGISSGYFGYFFYAMCGFLKAKFDVPLNAPFILVVTFVNLTIIFLLRIPLSSAPLLWPMVLFTLYLFYMNREELKAVLEPPENFKIKKLYYLVILFVSLIPLVSIHSIFPSISKMLTGYGTKVNVLAHLSGYFFGVFSAIIIEGLKEIRARP